MIFRLAGIYGPGRSSLEVLKAKKNTMVHKPGQVFSRIHIDDIAGSIMHLIHLFSTGTNPKIINLADNNPANNVEVLSYAANLLNIPLPPIESFIPFDILMINFKISLDIIIFSLIAISFNIFILFF